VVLPAAVVAVPGPEALRLPRGGEVPAANPGGAPRFAIGPRAQPGTAPGPAGAPPAAEVRADARGAGLRTRGAGPRAGPHHGSSPPRRPARPRPRRAPVDRDR